jgi:uncharacterized protein YaiE (UPF0345 family)
MILPETCPIQMKTMKAMTQFRIIANNDAQIETGHNSRMFRVDGGTAVDLGGGKSWRVSAEGEFYVPRGENRVISADMNQEVVIRELPT